MLMLYRKSALTWEHSCGYKFSNNREQSQPVLQEHRPVVNSFEIGEAGVGGMGGTGKELCQIPNTVLGLKAAKPDILKSVLPK